jgi:hypothetical protein
MPKPIPVRDLPKAYRLFHDATKGRCDPWNLAGSGAWEVCLRQDIMVALTGTNVLRKNCGVNALRAALYAATGATGDCEAAREDDLRAKILAALGLPVA